MADTSFERKLEELLNRKPSRWGNVPVGTFKQDIAFLQSVVREQQAKKERYRKEIVELRGKEHLSCPYCHEDCLSWVIDGNPCRDDW